MPQIIVQNFKINFQPIVFKNSSNNFLFAVLHLCEFKRFLNCVFHLPAWSKRHPQYIFPNSLSENIYIVFLTLSFDYLIYKVILHFLYLFLKNICSKCKPQFLRKNFRKSLALNGLRLA